MGGQPLWSNKYLVCDTKMVHLSGISSVSATRCIQEEFCPGSRREGCFGCRGMRISGTDARLSRKDRLTLSKGCEFFSGVPSSTPQSEELKR
jgi:hypothetical protein